MDVVMCPLFGLAPRFLDASYVPAYALFNRVSITPMQNQ